MTGIMNRAVCIISKQRISAILLQFIVILIAGSLVACVIAEPLKQEEKHMSQVITETNNGKTIELHVGDEVTLRLPENASTGYRWALEDVGADLVDVQEGKYISLSNAVGSGGEMQWLVRAKAAGSTQIKLKRWRQWEGEKSIIERFSVTLKIMP